MKFFKDAISAIQRTFNAEAGDFHEIRALKGDLSPNAADKILNIVERNSSVLNENSSNLDQEHRNRRVLTVYMGMISLLRDNGAQGCERFAAYHKKRGDYGFALKFINAETGVIGDDETSRAIKEMTADMTERFAAQIVNVLRDEDRNWSLAEQIQNITLVRDLARNGLLLQEQANGFKSAVEEAIKVRQSGQRPAAVQLSRDAV